MFKEMPSDTGMAFVIVQHLSPDFKSFMEELLARCTDIPIKTVVDGMRVKKNSIYLIPRKTELVLSQGKLHLTEKDPKSSLSLPIDLFFKSLASDAGSRSVAVVLSGSGSDGSRGVKEVNDVGGLVIAQSSASAKFDGMPKSAMATGICHLSIRPENIPRALLDYAENPDRDAISSKWQAIEVQGTELEQILELLYREHGFDFSEYRSS